MVSLCFAQTKLDSIPTIDDSSLDGSIYLTNAYIFIDSSSALTPERVLLQRFKPIPQKTHKYSIKPGQFFFNFYLKFRIKNSLDKEGYYYLNPGFFIKEWKLYKTDSVLYESDVKQDRPGLIRFKMNAGEETTILLYARFEKIDYSAIAPKLIRQDQISSYLQYINSYSNSTQLAGYIIGGMVLMMIFFMMNNYVISSKKEFLYNAIYSFCTLLLIFLNAYYAQRQNGYAAIYYNYVDFAIMITGVVFYIKFLRKFLETKKNYPVLDSALYYGNYLMLVLFAIYTFLNYFTQTFLIQFYLEICIKLMLLGLSMYFILFAIKQKNRLLNYIAAGNAILVIFSAISLVIGIIKYPRPNIMYSPQLYYNLGVIFELAIFLLGLTYKNRLELIENTKNREALKLITEKKEYETQLAIIKAQQEERIRISADMHDDLGAGMTSIRLYSELAKNKLNGISLPEIDKISSSANELLIKMNAIIWSMSSSNDTLGNLVAYIRSYALEFFEDTGILCKTQLPENLPDVVVIGSIRRNVFLIIKEALNNIVKHSDATMVNINLTREGNTLILKIQDNGKGIDLDNIRKYGNGINNMKKRAADIEIDLQIENCAGTLVILRRQVKNF